MMKIKRGAATVAAIAAAALLLTACAAAEPEAPSPEETSDEAAGLVLDGEQVADAQLLEAALSEGSLVFYTGSSEHAETQLASAFTEQTGIEVELVRLPPNRLYERILSEQSAGQLGADVMQLIGAPFTEPTLYRVAYAYEAATEHHLRRPPAQFVRDVVQHTDPL